MSTLTTAILLATKAHHGQVDKGGNPYILHPLRVMLSMPTIAGKMVGVLHDVVEDTPITIEDLREEGFSEEVTTAVYLLTKKAHLTKWENILRVTGNKLAVDVKVADLEDNMNLDRLPNTPSTIDLIRQQTYLDCWKFLKEGREPFWANSLSSKPKLTQVKVNS
jgi:(p)ppGpp synthase/HD superfamily hydrolase